MSRLRRIGALIIDSTDKVDGLTAKEADNLDVEICRLIVSKLEVDPNAMGPTLRMASWAARADYHQPLGMFTVNYDLLIETGLEALGVPYFDGFAGTMQAQFRSDLLEAAVGEDRHWLPAFLTRVWKLHGSAAQPPQPGPCADTPDHVVVRLPTPWR